MKTKSADNFFNDIDFVSILDTVKGIFTSDGSMSILLDFERVLDEADVYAFKHWLLGELVQGPDIRRYTVKCTFMWPYKLMPDPSAVKRLLNLGCKVTYGKSSIKVPIEVEDYEDFVPGTRYPKMKKRQLKRNDNIVLQVCCGEGGKPRVVGWCFEHDYRKAINSLKSEAA